MKKDRISDRPQSIYTAVHQSFAAAGDTVITHGDLYADVARRSGMSEQQFAERVPVGRSGVLTSKHMRATRWTLQTMRQKGLVQRVDGRRGAWKLTDAGKTKLTRVERSEILVAFSTKLGLALWAHCGDAFGSFSGTIHAVITSPPYALARPRSYGNPTQAEYVDWLCEALEPLVKRLARGGTIALNTSNDVFDPKLPSRALLNERLTIALFERLGLCKMDTLVWHQPCKAPSPVQWASVHRFQLHSGYEPILLLTNDPLACLSNNQRVLRPHTQRHEKLMARGGEMRSTRDSDGAHAKRIGSYGHVTAGAIPRNILTFPHTCESQRAYKRAARSIGLPAHSAPMPLALAKFLVEFLTEPGQLVVDPFGGSVTTGLAAECLGREWIVTDIHGEYLAGGCLRFLNADASRLMEQMFGVARNGQMPLHATAGFLD